MPEMLSLEQAAGELAVSLSTVRRLVDANHLTAVRFGRTRRVTGESVQAFKAAGGTSTVTKVRPPDA